MHDLDTQGAAFLHSQYPDFHNSPAVQMAIAAYAADGERTPNRPTEKIRRYMGWLAMNNSLYEPEPELPTLAEAWRDQRVRLIEQRVIDLSPDNAEKYARFQARVARELGIGTQRNPDSMNPSEKLDELRTVHDDQTQQLNDWIDELNARENKYPTWFKYWALHNVTRLTAFNEDVRPDGRPVGFEPRSHSSFALFPELDRESLSLVYDALVEKLGGPKMPYGDTMEQLRLLLGKANFAELYTTAQDGGFRITEQLKSVTDGMWHDFRRSSKPEDAAALASLIRTYRTGWCTAGSATAREHLAGGDFYVYCTLNPATGKHEVPRIAVRMSGDRVAEVRGIVGGRRQEIEGTLTDTAIEKIRDKDDGEQYFKMAEGMKQLTRIEREIVDNPDVVLSRADIRFLYELDGIIEGFGQDRDPRIAELRSMRHERDKFTLAAELSEVTRAQLRTASKVYTKIHARIARKSSPESGRPTKVPAAELKQLFNLTDRQWKDNGLYMYMASRLLAHDEHYTLTITPNTPLNESQITVLLKPFNDTEEEDSAVEPLLRSSLYNGDAWAGTTNTGVVNFGLVCQKTDIELSHKTVEDQLERLHKRRMRYPTFQHNPPSVLEAITYWYILRERGDLQKLSLSAEMKKATFVRHFTMPPRQSSRASSWHWDQAEKDFFVPSTFLGEDSMAHVIASDVMNVTPVRLLLR